MKVNSSPDKIGVKLGMWLFLYTEIMLFGGLFILYAAYYSKYTADFIEGGKALDLFWAHSIRSFSCLSSFTVAAAITAVGRQKNKTGNGFDLVISIIFGLLFLVNKYFEWGHKFEIGIYPGSRILEQAGHGKNHFFRTVLCYYRAARAAHCYRFDTAFCESGFYCEQPHSRGSFCGSGKFRTILASGRFDLDFHFSFVLSDFVKKRDRNAFAE